ncbi:hypothetical protein Tco_0158995, partial [Tanacetum coccineum]
IVRADQRQARVVLLDDEVFEDDSSKQGRKLSDEKVQEKANTDTELFIQEVTPTEVIKSKGAKRRSVIRTKELKLLKMKKLLGSGEEEEKSYDEAKSTKKIDWN